jgi:hypothetical protein
MRLRAVYAFNKSEQSAWGGHSGAFSPTRFVQIPICRSEDIQAHVGSAGLAWGHVVEVQETDAIFISTSGEMERVPIRHLRFLDFVERPV